MTDNQSQQNAEGQGPPQINFEALVENGKILGKYESPEALKEGYWNAVNEMNAAKQNLSTAVEVIKALKGSTPPQPTSQPAYEKQLADFGLPVEAIYHAVDARAQKIAEQMVSSQLSPLVQGAQARTQMASSYPDFIQNEGAIMSFVKSNPQLAGRFEALLENGLPYDALEIGYHHWKSTQQPRLDPSVDAARRAAQTPSGSGSASRLSGLPTGPSQQEMDEAQAAAMSGDMRPMIALRLKDVPLTYTEQMEALMRGRN